MQRFLFRAERIEASPAESGAEGSGVDGDDGPKARGRVVEEHDLLVLVTELIEDAHSAAGRQLGGRLSSHDGASGLLRGGARRV